MSLNDRLTLIAADPQNILRIELPDLILLGVAVKSDMQIFEDAEEAENMNE